MSGRGRCVIWDFDNTLACRPGLWSQCLADLVNERHPEKRATREQFVPHLARGFPWHSPEVPHAHLGSPDAWWAALSPTLEQALREGGALADDEAAFLADRVPRAYLSPERWIVFDDARFALQTLAGDGWTQVILSNHVPELSDLVHALGLAVHVSAIHTSAVVGFEKPHAGAFAAALGALPVMPARVVVVGDSYIADYAGARAAGLEAVLVRTSHPDCRHALPDLYGLPAWLNAAPTP